jgi:predicted O-methyltransferase YrrM
MKKHLPKKFWKTEEEIKNISRNEFINKLKIFGKVHNIPNISWTGVNILRFFLELQKPKTVLEMGCANGFSSIVIADKLEKWKGVLYTGDVSLPSIESAKENIKAINLSNIIIKTGNILETYSDIDIKFDLIFIDAQKSLTDKFFNLAKKLIKKDTLIIIDDVLKFSDKMSKFYEVLEKEKDEWTTISIPEKSEGDSILVLKKLLN